MKRITLVEIISSLLLCFYLFTAINSFFQIESLKNLLAFYTGQTTTVAWLLIASEVSITILLFMPRLKLAGFLGSLILIVMAAVFIQKYPHYPHDFGGLFNLIGYSEKWGLMIFIALFSLMGIALSLNRRKEIHWKAQL